MDALQQLAMEIGREVGKAGVRQAWLDRLRNWEARERKWCQERPDHAIDLRQIRLAGDELDRCAVLAAIYDMHVDSASRRLVSGSGLDWIAYGILRGEVRHQFESLDLDECRQWLDELRTKQTAGKGKPRGCSKPTKETIAKEAAIALEWRRAREDGEYKGAFAKRKEMKVKEFDRLLDRVAKRKRDSE
jgi:hypothetical protein